MLPCRDVHTGHRNVIEKRGGLSKGHLGGLPEAETLYREEIFLEQGKAASPVAAMLLLWELLQRLCQV